VLAAAVGAFHQQEIDIGHRHRIAQDLVVAAPDIAGEQEALLFPVILVVDLQQNLRAAEDVAGIDEGDGNAIAHRQRAVIADGHELPQAAFGVLLAVERRDGFEAVALAVFVEPVDVALLDARGVRQHDLAEIAGGVGGEDVSREALAW
jgi:hypothetical protein